MRYVESRYEEYQRDLAYRIYVTDSLYLDAQNKMMNMRYAEIIGLKKTKVDTRSGDEIAEDVIKRAGLEVNNGCI